MNREIKFRGLRVDNKKWVMGSLIDNPINFQHPLIGAIIYDGVRFDEPPSEHYQSFEVKPETVGQYTGLKDRNGKEIFEGDIVSYMAKNCSGEESLNTFTVDFIRDRWMLIVISSHIWMPGAKVFIPDSEFIEIIGNIYENPELLK